MHILGFNCFAHDAAAAIMRDGELLGMVEEERFLRRKHAGDFPAVPLLLVHGTADRITSAPEKHGAELARALGKMVGPDVRQISWFMRDLRHQRAFRRAVRSNLPDLGVLNGGPGTLFCASVCACCGFAPVDGPLAPPCCVACFTCLLE